MTPDKGVQNATALCMMSTKIEYQNRLEFKLRGLS